MITVGIRPDKECHIILAAQQRIELSQVPVGLLEPSRVEGVAFLPEELQRARDVREEEIGVVETQGQRMRWALFGVRWLLAFQHATKRIDEAARRGTREPGLEGAHP